MHADAQWSSLSDTSREQQERGADKAVFQWGVWDICQDCHEPVLWYIWEDQYTPVRWESANDCPQDFLIIDWFCYV